MFYQWLFHIKYLILCLLSYAFLCLSQYIFKWSFVGCRCISSQADICHYIWVGVDSLWFILYFTIDKCFFDDLLSVTLWVESCYWSGSSMDGYWLYIVNENCLAEVLVDCWLLFDFVSINAHSGWFCSSFGLLFMSAFLFCPFSFHLYKFLIFINIPLNLFPSLMHYLFSFIILYTINFLMNLFMIHFDFWS